VTSYPTVAEVLDLGRAATVRDEAVIESALTQVRATFGGKDLYPTLLDKASFLCVALVQGHAFADRNEDVGHAVLEIFLARNHARLDATPEARRDVLGAVAAGRMTRRELYDWLCAHVHGSDADVDDASGGGGGDEL
jgi:death-on-curing protein